MAWADVGSQITRDKTNWRRTKGNTDYMYPHTQGNGKQVETIRAGQTIRPVEHTRGRGKLPETRGEWDVKIKQEATRQHRHKTELKITNLTPWT